MIGIIGNGVVGSRLASALQHLGESPLIHDADPDRSQATMACIAKQCPFVFVCVPTPTVDNHQDLVALSLVLSTLEVAKYQGIVAISSTILPGTTGMLNASIPDLFIVHAPEFLNEAGGIGDVLGNDIIIGRDDDSRDEEIRDALGCFWAGEASKPFRFIPSAEAELIKYGVNVFYAVKNAYFNHLRYACDLVKADFDTVREGVVNNGFIHPVHTYSPGRDGLRGFGGSCLPKDLAAFIGWAEHMGVSSGMFREAQAWNQLIRALPKEEPRKDWEEHFEEGP